MTEDDLLMVRIQSGDSRAFDELVQKYQGPVCGFLLRQTRDQQLAEDLTQETLLRVFNQAWDYLPRGRFKGWMYRIARNLLIDNIRRQSHDALVKAVKGHSEDEDDAIARVAGEVLSPEQVANQHELVHFVDECLAEIPEEQRLTFLLHHYAGLPLAEVAEILETKEATCKSRLRLTREKLQDRLAQRGYTTSVEVD